MRMRKNDLLVWALCSLMVFVSGCVEDSLIVADVLPDNASLLLEGFNCSVGQVVKDNGVVWVCANDLVSNTTGNLSLASSGWLFYNGFDELDWNQTRGDGRYYLNTNPDGYVNFSDLDSGNYPNTSAEVVGLFTGCGGTDYLGADGACHPDTDTDTTIPDNFWPISQLFFENRSGILFLNETRQNQTILALNDGFEADSVWVVDNLYLNNVSNTLTFNETLLNQTINALDDVGGGGGWSGNITVNLTASTYDGNQNGYNGTNAICSAEFPNSHLCSGYEIIQFISRGESFYGELSDSSWYNTFSPKYIPASVPVDDCNGWTYSGTTTHLGTYWKWNDNNYGGAGKAINCGTALKLACCTNE